MSFASFVQAHAAHADWRVALAQSQRQVQTQIGARAAQQGESAPFTLGWCYLSDYYAPAAEAILDELRLRLPGVAWSVWAWPPAASNTSTSRLWC